MVETVERRLAALMSADVVSFSRMMAEDDEATLRSLRTSRQTVARLVKTFRGRVVDSPGDNILVEFPSAVGSVRCAVEIQRALAARNESCDREQRMQFRIGIHVGDVMADENDALYGDGVNIAARLESMASPGAICVSDFVYQQVRRRLDLPARDLGVHELKNIPEPVRAFEVAVEEQATSSSIARAAADPAPKPPEDKPSLAVLPFLNMSGDPTQDYFSDGLTLDVLEELIRLSGLFLVSGHSSASFQGSGVRPAEFAKQVGVRHVLEGAVRKANRRVRVSARLVEAESGQLEWADRYDRELEDMFEIQDEITERIVTALDIKLLSGEGGGTVRQAVRDPHARECIYKGWELFNRATKRDVAEARTLFEKAVDLEKESPVPYFYLSFSYYVDLERGWCDSREDTMKALSECAHRGLELGDISGISSMMLAHLQLLDRNYDDALDLSDAALRQRPSCHAVYCNQANILNYCGRPEEAIEPALHAIRLTPVTPTFYPEVLATAYYLTEQFEKALSECDRTLALAPDNVHAQLIAIASLMETCRLAAAQGKAAELLSKEAGFTVRRFIESQPYQDDAVVRRLGRLTPGGRSADWSCSSSRRSNRRSKTKCTPPSLLVEGGKGSQRRSR